MVILSLSVGSKDESYGMARFREKGGRGEEEGEGETNESTKKRDVFDMK